MMKYQKPAISLLPRAPAQGEIIIIALLHSGAIPAEASPVYAEQARMHLPSHRLHRASQGDRRRTAEKDGDTLHRLTSAVA